jgi:hypothetical protein
MSTRAGHSPARNRSGESKTPSFTTGRTSAIRFRSGRWPARTPIPPAQFVLKRPATARGAAMNFMQLLKSLDDLLYEVMSWLVFYPVTMWRALTRPLKMMDYSDAELGDRVEQQYTDTLSPPLFLLLSLIISHLVELASIGDSPLVGDTTGLAGLVNDDTSLLILRLLMFSIFPLIMATRLVRKQRIGLTRDTLRPPFYSQCYVAAPFVLTLSLAATLMATHRPWALPAGAGIMVLALLWYGSLQTRWFAQHLHVSLPRAFWQASVAMVESLAIVLAIAWIFS